MSIVLSSNKSDFKYNFNPSIKLDTNKINEIALLNIDMYHSVPNIDESNNEFMYEYNDVVFIKINSNRSLWNWSYKRIYSGASCWAW